MKEGAREPRRPEPDRDDVHVVQNRCPYCHDGVAPQDEGWVACRSCQARHHAACWEEARACSACGATARLVPEVQPAQGRPRGSGRRSRLVWVLAGLSALALVLGVGLVQRTRLRALAEQEAHARLDAERAEAEQRAARARALAERADLERARAKAEDERAAQLRARRAALRAQGPRRVEGFDLEVLTALDGGLEVVSVAPESWCGRAGLRVGDRVVGGAVGAPGQSLLLESGFTTPEALTRWLKSVGPGAPARLLVRREGRERELALPPRAPEVEQGGRAAPPAQLIELLGVEVRPAQPEGLEVVRVRPAGPGARMGLEVGDVVVGGELGDPAQGHLFLLFARDLTAPEPLQRFLERRSSGQPGRLAVRRGEDVWMFDLPDR